jgi:prepilin-type N-terminal cleavage/methylation domain-containing protein
MNYMKRQAGVTLIELIVAISIMAAMAVGLNSLISRASEDTRASVTALHLKTVGDAANRYIKDNYAAVTGTATATAPALIRVSDLITGGYLTTGYAVKNPHQQDTCVLVLEPTANNLTAIAITEAGETIDDLTLGQIAATIGGSGGGVYSTATTTIRGAMGGYSLGVGNFVNANNLTQKCDGTSGAPTLAAGHPMMALWFADGDSISAALYRDAVPGNPALNTMNTPIIMGAGTVQTADGACATIGALGRDNTGKVLMCDGANWKAQGSSFWGDPVANVAALPVCNAATAWQTRVVQTPTIGVGARPYTCNGAGTWQPLAVDDSGNLIVAGTTTTATLSVTGNASVGGNQTITGNLSVGGNTILGDASSDTVSIPGAASINQLAGNLEVTSVATEGVACSPNGRLARDVNGLLLSCQSGVWKKASGIGKQVASDVASLNGSRTITMAGPDLPHYKIESNNVYLWRNTLGTYQFQCTLSIATGSCQIASETCTNGPTAQRVFYPTMTGLSINNQYCVATGIAVNERPIDSFTNVPWLL